MSMVTYIGLNFEVSINDEYTGAHAEIAYCFSDEEDQMQIKENHFSTPYIYEVEQCRNPIWHMDEYHRQYSPHNYEKSKITFNYLCDLLKKLLPQGDYCEIYVCWIGEENEPAEQNLIIDLNNLQDTSISISEKCFIKIKN